MAEEEKKPLIGKTWKESRLKPKKLGLIVLGLFVLMIIVIAASGGEEKSKAPQIPFSQQEITEASIRKALKGVDLSATLVEFPKDITKIEVIDCDWTEAPDDKRVMVYYNPMTWDEEKTIKDAVHTAIQTMAALFKNPKMEEVVMWHQGDFTDKYGETTTETAVRIRMTKETADEIVDWKVVDDRAWGDYSTFFDLAELQYVHPAISKEL